MGTVQWVLPNEYGPMGTTQWTLLAFLNICQSSNKNPFHRCRVTLTQTLLIQVYISFPYLPFFFELLFTKNVQQTISIHIYSNYCNTGAPTSLHQLKEADPDLHSFLARFHVIPYISYITYHPLKLNLSSPTSPLIPYPSYHPLKLNLFTESSCHA